MNFPSFVMKLRTLPDNNIWETKVRKRLPHLHEAKHGVSQRELSHIPTSIQDKRGQLEEQVQRWITCSHVLSPMVTNQYEHHCVFNSEHHFLHFYLFGLVFLMVAWWHQTVSIDAFIPGCCAAVSARVGLLHGQEGVNALYFTLEAAVCKSLSFRGQTAGSHPLSVLLLLKATGEEETQTDSDMCLDCSGGTCKLHTKKIISQSWG